MASYFRIGWDHQKQNEYTEAVKYYELAIKAGHQGAKFHLDCMYSGQGIMKQNTSLMWNDIPMNEESIIEILHYYSELENHPHIQNNIGLIYRIYKKDIDTAEKYYRLSANQGYELAMSNLGNILKIKKLYSEMNEMYLLGAYKGSPHAQNYIGNSYLEGLCVTQDYERAIYWFLKAADQECTAAERTLGSMYEKGTGVPQDRETALKWYLRIAEHCDIVAYNYIGSFYIDSDPPDYFKAKEYYLLGIQKGNKASYCNLGNLYYEMKIWVDPDASNKIIKNYEETYKLYLLANQWTISTHQYNFAIFNEVSLIKYIFIVGIF